MNELLVICFTLGISIFLFLSMIEIPTWRLIFTGSHHLIEDQQIRFVHRNLRYLTSKLPATNGLVILGGVGLMLWQGFETSWSSLASAQLGIYLVGLFLIVVVFRNPKTVFQIRRHDSDTADIDLLIDDIRNVGRDHHIGLALNLTALIIQLLIAWS